VIHLRRYYILGYRTQRDKASWKFDAQLNGKDAIITSKDEELKAKDGIISARDATIKFQDALLAEYRNKLQIPTEVGQERKLAPEQRRVLFQELSKNIGKFPFIVVYASRDNEARNYAKQFTDLFSDLGISIVKKRCSRERNRIRVICRN
jgi:hypothetical protein